MREQQFGLEAGRIDAFFSKELGAALNDLQDGQLVDEAKSDLSPIQIKVHIGRRIVRT